MTTSALRPAGSTRRWRKIRTLVLIRDLYRCQMPEGVDDRGPRICGQYAHHVDHVVRRIDGGTDDLDNLRALCARHNLTRGAGRGHVRVVPRRWSW